jgi:hypothetical protein
VSLTVRVFISYSHDSDAHRQRVLELANRLRADGIDAQLDQFVPGTPPAGWDVWTMEQLDLAEYVLPVFTPPYAQSFRHQQPPGSRNGSTWEATIIRQRLYQRTARANRFIPIVFSLEERSLVPEPLAGQTSYLQPDEYGKLLKYLRGTAGVAPGLLGTLHPDEFDPTRSQGRRATFEWSGRPAMPRVFVGRVRELAELEAAVLGPAGSVVIVSAVGGQGKTTLVNAWLAEYEKNAAHVFEHVCYFSAYRVFVEYAGFLSFAVDSIKPGGAVGHKDEPTLRQELVTLFGRKRVLIVIDGLERWLQVPDASQSQDGQREDRHRNEVRSASGLDHLLQALSATRNGSRLVMTTRAIPRALDEVSSSDVTRIGTVAATGLPGLSEREGLLLLQRLRVHGTDREKRATVRELKGHPLSLTLLAGTLNRLRRTISERDIVYAELARNRDRLQSILVQAHHLCGGDAVLLQAAAIAPENASVEALVSALGESASSDRVWSTLQDLADWGLLSLAGPDENLLQLHPLVRSYFAGTVEDPKPLHSRLSRYFAAQPISDRARSLSRVKNRIWAVEHAAAAGDFERAMELLLEAPLVEHGQSGATLSGWFQQFGQSAFELEWARKLMAGAPHAIRMKLFNSMAIAARRCGAMDLALQLIEESLTSEDPNDRA